jgi:uncharacterized DUF497 family protein
MQFEWDPKKSQINTKKHGIAFKAAKALWNDPDRVVIRAPYPLENRYILIGQLEDKIWTAIYTIRSSAFRIISVRRARKKEEDLYCK